MEATVTTTTTTVKIQQMQNETQRMKAEEWREKNTRTFNEVNEGSEAFENIDQRENKKIT